MQNFLLNWVFQPALHNFLDPWEIKYTLKVWMPNRPLGCLYNYTEVVLIYNLLEQCSIKIQYPSVCCRSIPLAMFCLVLNGLNYFISARMSLQQCWFDFWGSIDQNGQTSMLMPILLRPWKQAHIHIQEWGLQDSLEVKSSCHWDTQLNTKRYILVPVSQM